MKTLTLILILACLIAINDTSILRELDTITAVIIISVAAFIAVLGYIYFTIKKSKQL